ncbi:MAG TPA: hypothetical protein VKC82_00310 [Burkholderiales bacterium]|nr:hypothetical protein [Burkholderiales bacterium]
MIEYSSATSLNIEGNFQVSRPMFRVMALASLIMLASCHRQAAAPADAPTGLAVAPGDGQVTVTWDQQPGLTYWIFFQAGDTVTAAAPGVPLLFDVQSPRIVFPLVNLTQYAFVMNATKDDSRAGPSTPVMTQTPRPSGASWTSGTPLGSPPQNLNGVAFSPTLNKLVAVGNAGTIFAGDFNYTSTDPPGVTAWTPPTSIPAGFVGDLSAVMFSGSQFIALGTDGSILTSADGNTWILSTHPVPSGGTAGPRMNSIAFGIVSNATIYVAVGDGGNIFTSPDLVTWTAAASPTVNLYNVSFPNGIFVATGASGTLLTSTDASTWTPQISHTPNALRGTTYGTGSAAGASAQYVVVGDSGTIVTSPDGTTWSVITPAPPLTQDLRAIRFGTRFVAVGQAGMVAYSDDPINTWATTSSGSAADLAAVIFTPGMYLAVGASGANAVSK